MLIHVFLLVRNEAIAVERSLEIPQIKQSVCQRRSSIGMNSKTFFWTNYLFIINFFYCLDIYFGTKYTHHHNHQQVGFARAITRNVFEVESKELFFVKILLKSNTKLSHTHSD